MIAASDESTCTSPAAISGNGIDISTTASATSHRHPPRSVGSVPARQASANSTTAASVTRPQASASGGTPPSTAILMNRYEAPQMIDIAANAIQARRLIRAQATT